LIRFFGEAGVIAPAINLGMSILDSPATTSSITYQVYFRTSGGTSFLNFENTKGSITVMEIKG